MSVIFLLYEISYDVLWQLKYIYIYIYIQYIHTYIYVQVDCTQQTQKLFLGLGYNEVVAGYIGFTPSVCPFVRPAFRVRSVAPTVLVGSISYLYILSSNFRRCVACKVACKISKFDFFFLICNFDFVLFWLGIWCESLWCVCVCVCVCVGGGGGGGGDLRTQVV